MKNRQAGCTQEASAAKAGISVRSGRRIEKGEMAEPKERSWRTRQDPFEAVWASELVPLLNKEPSITGITAFLVAGETHVWSMDARRNTNA